MHENDYGQIPLLAISVPLKTRGISQKCAFWGFVKKLIHWPPYTEILHQKSKSRFSLKTRIKLGVTSTNV